MKLNVDGLLGSLLPRSMTQEQIEEVRLNRVAEVMDFVTGCYPQINIATLEKNLSIFQYLKRQDDACRSCMSIEMCLTKDGNRMSGKLMADGIVTIWQEPCPRSMSPSKTHGETASEKAEKKWTKSARY